MLAMFACGQGSANVNPRGAGDKKDKRKPRGRSRQNRQKLQVSALPDEPSRVAAQVQQVISCRLGSKHGVVVQTSRGRWEALCAIASSQNA